MTDLPLINKRCQSEVCTLSAEQAEALMPQLHIDWEISNDDQIITRTFRFKNYYQTIAFVNALAWVAHDQDHHPDVEVSYNRCAVHFSTHSVGGLSENDFICAIKLDALISAAD